MYIYILYIYIYIYTSKNPTLMYVEAVNIKSYIYFLNKYISHSFVSVCLCVKDMLKFFYFVQICNKRIVKTNQSIKMMI